MLSAFALLSFPDIVLFIIDLHFIGPTYLEYLAYSRRISYLYISILAHFLGGSSMFVSYLSVECGAIHMPVGLIE